jgi:hypothetical protein
MPFLFFERKDKSIHLEVPKKNLPKSRLPGWTHPEVRDIETLAPQWLKANENGHAAIALQSTVAGR